MNNTELIQEVNTEFEELKKSLQEEYSEPYTGIRSIRSSTVLKYEKEFIREGWILCRISSVYLPKDLLQECVNSDGGKFLCAKVYATYNPIDDTYFCSHVTSCGNILWKDKIISLPVNTIERFPNYIVSSNLRVYSPEDICFREHSGAGFGVPKTYKPVSGKYLGIEIECCIDTKEEGPFAGAERKIKFAKELTSKFPEWVVERDGSLEKGVAGNDKLFHSCMEIVSPPATYTDLRQYISDIFPLLKEYEVKAASIGDFFAIHITCNMETQAGRIKMLRAVYNPKFWTFWKRVSSRPCNNGFNPRHTKPYCCLYDFSEISDSDLLMVCSENHYKAAYLRRSGSIEIRVFQTKINLKYINNILELISILWDFSHSSHDNWFDYLNNIASPSLRDYLSKTQAFKTTKFDKFIDLE